MISQEIQKPCLVLNKCRSKERKLSCALSKKYIQENNSLSSIKSSYSDSENVEAKVNDQSQCQQNQKQNSVLQVLQNLKTKKSSKLYYSKTFHQSPADKTQNKQELLQKSFLDQGNLNTICNELLRISKNKLILKKNKDLPNPENQNDEKIEKIAKSNSFYHLSRQASNQSIQNASILTDFKGQFYTIESVDTKSDVQITQNRKYSIKSFDLSKNNKIKRKQNVNIQKAKKEQVQQKFNKPPNLFQRENKIKQKNKRQKQGKANTEKNMKKPIIKLEGKKNKRKGQLKKKNLQSCKSLNQSTISPRVITSDQNFQQNELAEFKFYEKLVGLQQSENFLLDNAIIENNISIYQNTQENFESEFEFSLKKKSQVEKTKQYSSDPEQKAKKLRKRVDQAEQKMQYDSNNLKENSVNKNESQ